MSESKDDVQVMDGLLTAMERAWDGLRSNCSPDCAVCSAGLYAAGPTEWQLAVLGSGMPFDTCMYALWVSNHADENGHVLIDDDGVPSSPDMDPR